MELASKDQVALYYRIERALLKDRQVPVFNASTGGNKWRKFTGYLGTVTAGKSVDDFLGLFNNNLAQSALIALKTPFSREEESSGKLDASNLGRQMNKFNELVREQLVRLLYLAADGVYIEEKLPSTSTLNIPSPHRHKSSKSPKRRNNFKELQQQIIKPVFDVGKLLMVEYDAYRLSLTRSTNSNMVSSSNSASSTSVTNFFSRSSASTYITSQYGYPLTAILLDRFILHCAAIMGDKKFTWIRKEGIVGTDNVLLESSSLHSLLLQILGCELPAFKDQQNNSAGLSTNISSRFLTTDSVFKRKTLDCEFGGDRYIMWNREGPDTWNLFRYLKRKFFELNGELKQDPFLYYL